MSLADEKILGLTIHRPYSELVAGGVKTLENRSWKPSEALLGKYIAIHAGRWNQEGADFIARNASRFQVPCAPQLEHCKAGIIAVGRLVGWVERTELGQPGPKVIAMLPGHSFTEVDWRWFFDRYGWLLRDVRRISPVACRGRQGLWALPATVYDSVRSKYRRAA